MIKSIHILNGHLNEGYNQAYYWVNDHPLYDKHKKGVKSMARAENTKYSSRLAPLTTHSTVPLPQLRHWFLST